jgi:hypothetical protein
MRRVHMWIAAVALAAFPSAISAQPTSCGDPVYVLDPDNVTGWQHDILKPIPPERAWFEDGELVVDRDGTVARYVTGGAGSGIRIRIGRTDDIPEGQPGQEISYVFYDLAGIARVGAPDHVLVINDDLYWPTCGQRPDRLPSRPAGARD